MADANYFHTTLYAFSDAAQKTVITRFHSRMNDTAARCWYDAELQLFELRCPSNIGFNADEVLADIVSEYMDQELKDAERRERAPEIVRFPESTLEAQPLEGLGLDETAVPVSSIKPQATPIAPPPVLHLIDTESAAAAPQMKLFRLEDLPEALLERVLGQPADKKTERAVRSGLTCRAVRSEGQRACSIVFNGRLGEQLPDLHETEEADLLSMAPFQTLMGDVAVEAPEPKVSHWRFQKGYENIDVKQWLGGMGQAEVYDPEAPEAAPSMPKDTWKLLARDEHAGTGRIRMPKGANMLQAESEAEDEMSDDSDDALKPGPSGFGSLLKAQDDSENDIDLDAEPSPGSGPTTFSSLLGTQHKERTQPASGRAQAPLLLAVITSMTDYVPGGQDSAIVLSEACADEEHSEAGTFMSYGKAFAIVDTIGLTASARSQAEWELQASPPRKRQPKGKVQLAQRPSINPLLPIATNKGRPTTLTTADGPPIHLLHGSSSKAARDYEGPATVRSPAGYHLQNETAPWEHWIVQSSAPQDRLIDDLAPPSMPLIRLPPGLAPPPSHSKGADSVTADHPTPAYAQPTATLIDIDENEEFPVLRRSQIMPPPGLTRKPLRPTVSVSTSQQLLYVEPSINDVVERLQAPGVESSPVRITMRQRALKKGKGKAATVPKAAFKAELPLPEPLLERKDVSSRSLLIVKQHVQPSSHPPVQQRSRRKTVSRDTFGPLQSDNKDKPSATNKLAVDAGPVTTTCGPDAVDEQTPASTSITTEANAAHEQSATVSELQAFIDRLLFTHHRACVVAQVGLILFTHTDKSKRKAAFTASRLEAEVIKNVQFLPRLTTATSDAWHVLGMVSAASPLEAHASYEFHVRGVDGHMHIKRCGAEKCLLPACDDQVYGTAFVHYPFRVWDARYEVRALENDNNVDPAFQQFVKSITTTEEAPSFYAGVPQHRFSVEKALAKRDYIRVTHERAKVIVTEVQDLILQSMDHPVANLQATCPSRQEMMDEHRLWWEVKVEYADCRDAGFLQRLVDSLVTQMDGVGYANKGPWERRQDPAVTEMAPAASSDAILR
ncbi:hypothetical protein BAUCODRAFT_150496 [Baudoinia panamericana UAMH 10762]|uniref:Uncharacterized protein n=1 Tax=Baudoinia panamericana (strain UAMH 10762) TaxID=717646 RepID=M2N2B6_BAUPA|nr:uncharacterized protein BAUCODRAFT_150496 [Baudoinia panamericana UAMH 10762]EMC93124.1 hypothetical protein BAUCODRAFT_150496 [Baudoinia panamericana UAMH 10762]